MLTREGHNLTGGMLLPQDPRLLPTNVAALWGTAAALDVLPTGQDPAPSRTVKQPVKKKRRVDAGAT